MLIHIMGWIVDHKVSCYVCNESEACLPYKVMCYPISVCLKPAATGMLQHDSQVNAERKFCSNVSHQ